MAKILLVEDHRDTREVLRLLLEMDGYEIVEAHTGEDAIRAANESAPDLILMDISLAGDINGLEATRRLRADSKFDKTVIVALTAHAMKGDREMTFAAGCDGYWTKPIIDFAEFRQAIADAIKCGRNGSRNPLLYENDCERNFSV
jgi:two-component system, cell cycle response regulator DivK